MATYLLMTNLPKPVSIKKTVIKSNMIYVILSFFYYIFLLVLGNVNCFMGNVRS